jgi:hypothetical protein
VLLDALVGLDGALAYAPTALAASPSAIRSSLLRWTLTAPCWNPSLFIV